MSDNELLESYARVVGRDVMEHLGQLSAHMRDLTVVHVNSTREGGGVAEILRKLIPLKRALGVDAHWEVIEGENDFYQCTKSFHNALQGERSMVPKSLIEAYEETNRDNVQKLRPVLKDADVVFIHDPQPAPLLNLCPERRGKWIWRCHIDVSRPYRPVWKYLRDWVTPYDASIFSLAEFAQPLAHPQYLVPPSIDPLSEKNMDLPEEEVDSVFDEFNLKRGKPLILQVSRFDRFKDPVGVIEAYRLARKLVPIQLVLAGGSATDDPEGELVLKEVRMAANDDPDIHILLLPADAHREINALQRAADIVLQKSTREGFGLTVTEAMWKGKPVIGGDTGGIRLQVVNHHTGFLVNTPEGAALWIRYLMHHREKLRQMGETARTFVKENFLITRHLKEYLALTILVRTGGPDRIEVGM